MAIHVISIRPVVEGRKVRVNVFRSEAIGEEKTFEDAVKQLQRDGQLPNRTQLYFQLTEEYSFQKELFIELEKLSPTALAKARRSSMSVHRPGGKGLYEIFPTAIMNTPTVHALNAVLNAHGMELPDPSFEQKFVYVKSAAGESIQCPLWLRVSPLNVRQTKPLKP